MDPTTFKQVKNNAKSIVAPDELNNTTTTLAFDIHAGDGDKFPETPGDFWVTVWDRDKYADPGDDPNMRIGTCTARTGDEFTVTWGQFGTPIVAIPGTPAIALHVIDQHLKDIHTSINVLEGNRQAKMFATVGRSNADFITDGVADDVQIQAALDAVNAAGGGIVKLTDPMIPYICTTILTIGSNTTLEGFGRQVTTIEKLAGQNSSILTNKDTTNGNSRIIVRGLTLNQNGASQTFGGGMTFTGLFDSSFENIGVEYSRTFNLFVSSVAGTLLTGTFTFTNGQAVVTGSGTAFQSELAVGDIIKSAGAHFQRVTKITSDTSLTLDRAWGWATESGVAASKIPANARNRILNCNFNGNATNDNVGLGLFDDSLIQGCISRNSTGYGFGPDHTNRLKFIGNTCHDNPNSGIGMETCGYSVINGNVFYRNSNGIYLLSGSWRNIISNNQSRSNANGIGITYNSTSFPPPDENSLIGNILEYNTGHGIRVGGAHRTIVQSNRSMNNVTSGLATASDNSRVPDLTQIIGNHMYDSQDVKTQVRGIWLAASTNAMVMNNISRIGDHVTAGFTDAGTGTQQANNIFT